MRAGARATRRTTLGLMAATAVAGCARADEVRYFHIGTGGPQGTYFPIGGIIAGAISNPPGSRACDEGGSCGVPGLLATAQSSNGSVDNVNAIGEGRIESGFSQADVAFWALNGTSMFAENGAIANLRAIARLYRESVHLVARAEAGIARIEDLAGKRVALGEEGSGTLVDARSILTAFGVGEASVEPVLLKPDKASTALIDGQIDAFFIIAGYPTAAVRDLAETIAITLVPIAGAALDDLLRQQPFFTRDFVPFGVYHGVNTTETLSVAALWLVAAEQDEELVHGVTAVLWHDSTRRLLDEGHEKGKDIRLEFALQGVPVPLHPGAERYYREVGLLGAL
ncbi:MAG: TAXI family TRAP transporter solute-binding subunit [Alphaproteobacteria bacterium]|nr:TAXI family TRAP transporter solute-binding subunit [Alphaproteobacteria bacterium]